MSYRTLMASASVTAALSLGATAAYADFVINDDLIVDGSACIGFDCVNGESFGFDTLRLKENNLRIKFDDTSVAASFPNNDWQITANASANGGANKFSIDDISGNRTPFTIEANARSNSLYVDDGGRIGIRTATPSTEIHVIDGDTPTLRLQQDGSSGFAPQTWDVAGNETNFFIRDVTNGSLLPLRIRPDAPTSSIFIDVDGDVGMGTSSPDDALEVSRSGATAVAMRLTNGTGSWRFNHNGVTGNLNIARDGGTTPIKVAPTANTNLLLVGTNAVGQVDITGDLVVSGQCTETDGACADYVFGPDHERLSLPDLRAFIAENRHLPNVPSEAEIRANGVNMAQFSGRLLEKIEELALYTLEQEDVIAQQNARIERLEQLVLER